MASPLFFASAPCSYSYPKQETRSVCNPRSPPHSNGISSPTIHLSWFTPLVLRTNMSNVLRTLQRRRFLHTRATYGSNIRFKRPQRSRHRLGIPLDGHFRRIRWLLVEPRQGQHACWCQCVSGVSCSSPQDELLSRINSIPSRKPSLAGGTPPDLPRSRINPLS
jgi:hypothetical protein